MKVLIVTYYFPPAGGAGVQRTLKFVKYLREFGWEPVVLTAQNADYPAYDESLLKELPQDVKIYRSKIIEPYKLYKKLTGKKEGTSSDIATLTLSENQKRKKSEVLSEWIRSAFFVPDARMLWYFFATRLGRKIIKNEKIDLIFSSAPPYTTHLIGHNLAKNSDLPWIADFRDSWIGWLSTPQWRPKLSRAIEKKMEKAVLRDATKILTVSKGVKEDLLSRNLELDDNRWILLPNGYDSQDFGKVSAIHKDSRLIITYTGSMYGNRNPESLVAALEELIQTKPGLEQKLLIRLVGRVGGPIIDRITSSPVSNLFELVPYVTHAQSLEYLLSTDFAMLIIDDAPANKGILTGKLFEYIGAGKPILALAPDGEAADLIQSEGLGVVCHPNDINAIKTHILEILENPSPKNKILQPADKFDRITLTKHLAGIFYETLNHQHFGNNSN
jgi:glycosyltransferase involved in cell wall biosynthesis